MEQLNNDPPIPFQSVVKTIPKWLIYSCTVLLILSGSYLAYTFVKKDVPKQSNNTDNDITPTVSVIASVEPTTTPTLIPSVSPTITSTKKVSLDVLIDPPLNLTFVIPNDAQIVQLKSPKGEAIKGNYQIQSANGLYKLELYNYNTSAELERNPVTYTSNIKIDSNDVFGAIYRVTFGDTNGSMHYTNSFKSSGTCDQDNSHKLAPCGFLGLEKEKLLVRAECITVSSTEALNFCDEIIKTIK